LNRPAIRAYSWNDDFNSETTACAENTISDLYNRVGDGCAVRLRTNSLSRLAYPRMPQRLLRKAGTAPHSCRVPRFQRMANYTGDRLADWNSRPAFPSTREAKGQQMTPTAGVELSGISRPPCSAQEVTTGVNSQLTHYLGLARPQPSPSPARLEDLHLHFPEKSCNLNKSGWLTGLRDPLAIGCHRRSGKLSNARIRPSAR
jgi:hypothetical protein